MSNDDSTTIAAITTSVADKIVGALTKTSAAMAGNQDVITSTVHSTTLPGGTAQAQWARCSGWNSTEFSSSFLEHASGQGISGACAWAAILITCHQVKMRLTDGDRPINVLGVIWYIILRRSKIKILDISILTVVYKSGGTTMDC